MFKGYAQQYEFRVDKGEGSYRVSVASGLLSGVAAYAADANGHLFAARWSPATGLRARTCVIRRCAVSMQTITGFTGAQEVGMSLYQVRGYSVNHSSGTAIDLGGTVTNSAKKRTAFPAANVGMVSMRMAAAAQLTAGTQTFDPNPVAQDSYTELATGAAVPKSRVAKILISDSEVDPIVLAPDEGIVVTNNVALGGGGTCRLVVELDWIAVERF